MTLPPVAAPKRSPWPWIIGGVAGLILLGIGIAIGVLLIAAGQKEADLESVEQTVVDFDSAFEELDCDLFEQVTDANLRDDLYAPDGYDCDVWAENAKKFFDEDGDYTFDVEVQAVRVSGDRARVNTVENWEVDGEKYSGTVIYRLERVSGGWVITEYKDTLDESDEPAEEPEEEQEEPEPTADDVVAEDLKNAKAALMAYYLVEGGWEGVTEQELEVYGYGASLGTINMMYYIEVGATDEAAYCIDATASETGNSYWIRPDTIATPGFCSDPVE